MKKIFKRIIAICATLVMFVSYNLNVLAADITYNINMNQAINALLQCGWTMDEIDYFLTDEMILQYKDVQAVLSSEKMYYRVTNEDVYSLTEEECMIQLEQIEQLESAGEDALQITTIVPEGEEVTTTITTTDGYMEMYVEVYNCGNGEFICGARYEWLISPWNRKKDVFALGHSANTILMDDYDIYTVYKADYTIINGAYADVGTYVYEQPDVLHVGQGGVAVSYDLENDDMLGTVSAYNHRGYIQYRVKLTDNDEQIFSVHADYLHQEAVIAITPSISFPLGLSVSVDQSSKFKIMSPNPYMSVEWE